MKRCQRCGDIQDRETPHSVEHCIFYLKATVEALQERREEVDANLLKSKLHSLFVENRELRYEVGQLREVNAQLMQRDSRFLNSAAVDEQLLVWVRTGMTHQSMADRLGVERSAVTRRLNKMGIQRRPRSRVR